MYRIRLTYFTIEIVAVAYLLDVNETYATNCQCFLVCWSSIWKYLIL